MSVPVALLHVPSYDQPDLRRSVFAVMDSCGLGISQGQKILVKPNLLMAYELSCTNAAVIANACEWLQNHGAKVTVADSPAFGTCRSVAKAIGLSELLKPLGLVPQNFTGKRTIVLNVERKPEINVASAALESDAILSIPRVKAHSQMRITLAVKNCYGCIPGVRKAIAHSRWGESVEYFSNCVAALFGQLPPVMALADGVIAMNETGPRFGTPYNLGLLAASASATVLDTVLMKILNIPPDSVPLAMALKTLGSIPDACFPLEKPDNFAAPGFTVPKTLKNISFNPFVLAKSLIKRVFKAGIG